MRYQISYSFKTDQSYLEMANNVIFKGTVSTGRKYLFEKNVSSTTTVIVFLKEFSVSCRCVQDGKTYEREIENYLITDLYEDNSGIVIVTKKSYLFIPAPETKEEQFNFYSLYEQIKTKTFIVPTVFSEVDLSNLSVMKKTLIRCTAKIRPIMLQVWGTLLGILINGFFYIWLLVKAVLSMKENRVLLPLALFGIAVTITGSICLSKYLKDVRFGAWKRRIDDSIGDDT